MTTAAQTAGSGSTPGVAGRAVRRALVVTLVLGLVLAAVGGFLSGSPALVGALVGTALVCGFFGLGAVVLIWVTQVSPAASLLVGVLTYTLQVVVLGIVFAALQGSGLMGPTVDGVWLGCTVIAGTVAWLAIQVTLTLRARLPYFDLPSGDRPTDAPGDGPVDGPGDGPGATEAGAR